MNRRGFFAALAGTFVAGGLTGKPDKGSTKGTAANQGTSPESPQPQPPDSYDIRPELLHHVHIEDGDGNVLVDMPGREFMAMRKLYGPHWFLTVREHPWRPS